VSTDLAGAVEAALPGWVVAAVAARAPGLDDQARAAGERAAAEVLPALRALLELDIDEQRTTPLVVLRDAVRYPTEVLAGAGVPPVARDAFEQERFPDDVYGLMPASFADFGPEVGEAGLAWGAAKAWEHKRRHGSPA
jgi:hypothetical protein